MTDREKIIKGVECCSKGCRYDCQYFTGTLNFECVNNLMSDTLTMLKEQEEQIKNRDKSLEKARKEIEWLRRMQEPALLENQHKPYGNFLNANAPWISRCPKCGKKVEGKQTRYCKYCGRAVKWK